MQAEIHLGYYEQGDDLDFHLGTSATIEEALENHAASLEDSVEHLRKIKELIRGHDVKFDADTHMIMIEGPDDVIQKLVDEELATILEFEDGNE